MSRTWSTVIFCIGIGMLGILAAFLPMGSTVEENWGLHLLHLLRGPKKPPADLVIITLDPESSRVLSLPLEPRKWPRSVHGRLVDRLNAAGAKVIAFDLIFSDAQDPQSDYRFAEAARNAENLVLTRLILLQRTPYLSRMDEGIMRQTSPLRIFNRFALRRIEYPTNFKLNKKKEIQNEKNVDLCTRVFRFEFRNCPISMGRYSLLS